MGFRRTVALVMALALMLSAPAVASTSQSRQVLSVAVQQLGKPYAVDCDMPNSFNCLSLVVYCFNQVNSGLISDGRINGRHIRIKSKNSLRPADVVCFKTSQQDIGVMGYHFGIYAGRGYFIHASSSAGKVIISRMKDYNKRFLGAVRIL